MTLLTGEKPTTEEISDLLRRHDISPTLQRVQIAQLLFSHQRHLSAEQALEEVNAVRKVASKATMYNTLRIFTAKGLVREIIADPTKTFYEPANEPHFHFFDTAKRTLIDIDPSEVAFARLPKTPDGYRMGEADVIFRITPTS